MCSFNTICCRRPLTQQHAVASLLVHSQVEAAEATIPVQIKTGGCLGHSLLASAWEQTESVCVGVWQLPSGHCPLGLLDIRAASDASGPWAAFWLYLVGCDFNQRGIRRWSPVTIMVVLEQHGNSGLTFTCGKLFTRSILLKMCFPDIIGTSSFLKCSQ